MKAPKEHSVTKISKPILIIVTLSLVALAQSPTQPTEEHAASPAKAATGAGAAATPAKTEARGPARRETPPPGPPISHSVPFQIEAGLTAQPTVITLAVDAVTAFHCPEPILKLFFGEKAGIGEAESVRGQNRNTFYLRPTKGGVVTNVVIEMQSSTVTLHLRTVKVNGGPRLGDYNGEVFVRFPGFKDEILQTREALAVIQKDLAACGGEKEQALERAHRERDEAVATAEANLLQESMRIIQNGSAKVLKHLKTSQALVSQIGRPLHFNTGRWWVLLEVQNRDKKAPLAIRNITAEGYGRVLFSARQVDPKERILLGIAIDPLPPNAPKPKTVAQFEPTLSIEFGNDSLVFPLAP
jgi:hypothetical protein